MNGSDFGEYFTDAIRFWEPCRVLYNLALATIVVAYFVAGYPKSKLVLSVWRSAFFCWLWLPT